MEHTPDLTSQDIPGEAAVSPPLDVPEEPREEPASESEEPFSQPKAQDEKRVDRCTFGRQRSSTLNQSSQSNAEPLSSKPMTAECHAHPPVQPLVRCAAALISCRSISLGNGRGRKQPSPGMSSGRRQRT